MAVSLAAPLVCCLAERMVVKKAGYWVERLAGMMAAETVATMVALTVAL